MIELLIRVLCEPLPPVSLPAAYLFAQTADNQLAVFETGVQLLRQGQAARLLLPGAAALGGYPGYLAWHAELTGYGLNDHDLIAVPPASSTALNTLVEAEALVRYARGAGLTGLFVVAPPFHQMRAFMTVVTVARRDFPALRVYNRVGAALPWHETVVHSQGLLQCRRTELIQAELERIDRYQRKGDLASAEEVLAYLNRRDNN